MTSIRFLPSSLKEGRWYEYLVRFALGGAATVFTGLVSSRYGASVGGLFLALPARLEGGRRGQMAAALDAAGAALGALGMVAFAVVFWMTVRSSIASAFIGASHAWLFVAVAAWYVRRQMRSAKKGRNSEKDSGSAVSRGR
jgi:hypothetical protein